MTRKDYVAIAAIIHREHEKLDQGKVCDPRTRLHVITNKLAKVFEADNPRFDRERFGRACSTFWD